MKFEEVEKEIIKKAFDLKKYINTLETNNIDTTYEKNYASFYKVRRNKQWRSIYYKLLKENKNNKNITFEEIITYLYKNTEKHNIEASFSSKLLATINPNKPIWDRYVLEHIVDKDKIKEFESKKGKEKLQDAIKIYNIIEEKYKEYLEDKDIQNTIGKIKEILNEAKLTDTKILDYIIWTLEKEKQKKRFKISFYFLKLSD